MGKSNKQLRIEGGFLYGKNNSVSEEGIGGQDDQQAVQMGFGLDDDLWKARTGLDEDSPRVH